MGDSCAHDLITAQATAHPEAVAVAHEGVEMTYGELETRANQLAHHLIDLGVGPGALVAVHLERTPELLVALLGVLKTGAGYVPIDARVPWRRVEFIVADVRSPIVLTEQRLVDGLAGVDAPTILLDAAGPTLSARSLRPPARRGTPDDPAYVMYTSGTTGVPNGVVAPHRALTNYLTWCVEAYDMRSGAGSLVHSSIGFDLTVTTLLGPLIVGQRVILLPEQSGIRALETALRTAHDLTIVKLTPTHLKVLGLLLTPAEIAGRVRTLVVGGEDLRAEALELFRGEGGPRRIVNEYGPTETVVGCCAHVVAPDDPPVGRVPIGAPVAGAAIGVVDSQLRPTPDGTPGEALIGGAGVTDGYLRRPELTAERFLTDPFSAAPGRRVYRTGDLVRRRVDGQLEYLGRLDDQVKIRGVRVELAEIEATLRGHPEVAEAVVTIHAEGSSAPVEDPRPVAHVLPAAGSEPTSAALTAYCRERLPEFLQPDAFFLVDALPTTSNGKLDRSALSGAPGRHTAAPARRTTAQA